MVKKGVKTGWTYIDIPFEIANQLKPNNKKNFRVKGTLADIILPPIAILPMGEGCFIMPLNLVIRKLIKKQQWENVLVALEMEEKEYELNQDFIACLNDEPKAFKHFNALTKGHHPILVNGLKLLKQ